MNVGYVNETTQSAMKQVGHLCFHSTWKDVSVQNKTIEGVFNLNCPKTNLLPSDEEIQHLKPASISLPSFWFCSDQWPF